MSNSENSRPVLDEFQFNAYEVSVFDVYPPAYVLPSKASSVLSSYGLEGYVEVQAGRDQPLEDRTRLLLFRKHEEGSDPVYVLHGQKVLFYGPADFSISSDW